MSIAPERPPRTLWEEGRVPAREVLALGSAVVLTATLLDLALSDELGLFFDLVFVTACVAAALAVQPREFFSVGTWPPLAMLGTVLLIAIAQPAAIADPEDGLVQAAVSGLSHHSLALVIGYAAALAVLVVRRGVMARS